LSNPCTRDKEMLITTLINLRLWSGQLQDLEDFSNENQMDLNETVSMLVSKGLEDLHHEEPDSTIQLEPQEPNAY